MLSAGSGWRGTIITSVGPRSDLFFVSQQNAGDAHDQDHNSRDDADWQVNPEDYFP
jgi:hypothetical protein